MSDIEDEMEWEEDEEDMLFIDDGDPELADELVLGTTHSPLYIGEIALDAALESDSDWDEYEENPYFDQDPTAWKKGEKFVNTPGNSALKRKSEDNGRGQKRRKVEKDGKNGVVDPTTFVGVIWRTDAHSTNPAQPYEPGQENGVSLLRNWREITSKKQGRRIAMAREPTPPDDGPEIKQEVEDEHEEVAIPDNSPPADPDDEPESSTLQGYESGDFTLLDKKPEKDQIPGSLFPMDARPPKAKQRVEKRLAAYKTRPSSRLKQVVSVEDIRTPESSTTSTLLSPSSKGPASEQGSAPMSVDGQSEGSMSRGKKRKARGSSEDKGDTVAEGKKEETKGTRKRGKRSENPRPQGSQRRSSRLKSKA